MKKSALPCGHKRCGTCAFWKKANNKFKGIPAGQCSKGFYSIMLPLDRIQPYYLEKAVTLDDGNIACGKFRLNKNLRKTL
jgi:hypothetical protein